MLQCEISFIHVNLIVYNNDLTSCIAQKSQKLTPELRVFEEGDEDGK